MWISSSCLVENALFTLGPVSKGLALVHSSFLLNFTESLRFVVASPPKLFMTFGFAYDAWWHGWDRFQIFNFGRGQDKDLPETSPIIPYNYIIIYLKRCSTSCGLLSLTSGDVQPAWACLLSWWRTELPLLSLKRGDVELEAEPLSYDFTRSLLKTPLDSKQGWMSSKKETQNRGHQESPGLKNLQKNCWLLYERYNSWELDQAALPLFLHSPVGVGVCWCWANLGLGGVRAFAPLRARPLLSPASFEHPMERVNSGVLSMSLRWSSGCHWTVTGTFGTFAHLRLQIYLFPRLHCCYNSKPMRMVQRKAEKPRPTRQALIWPNTGELKIERGERAIPYVSIFV